MTAEDGPHDTIRPRLDKLKADVTRIHNLDAVQCDGTDVALNLDEHLSMVERWLRAHPDVRIVVLDPLAAFLGKINAHRNDEVRALLKKVNDRAAKLGVTFLMIDHLAKPTGDRKAVHRGIASIAFTAAPRAVWQVVQDGEDPDRSMMLPVKLNLCKATGLAFRRTDAGIEWETEPVTRTADEVANETASDTPRDEAKDWIRELLKKGPFPGGDVEKMAATDGLCYRTVKYAKKELGVVSRKNGKTGQWSWMWPEGKRVKP